MPQQRFISKATPSGGTKVLVHTNLTLSGSVAQYGRGVGIIQITAGQIITQFANNLKAQLAARPSANVTAATAAPDTGAADAIAPATTAAAAPRPRASQQTTTARLAHFRLGVSRDGVGAACIDGFRCFRHTRKKWKPPPSQTSAAKPISGFALMGRVLWEGVKRLFGWRQNRRL